MTLAQSWVTGCVTLPTNSILLRLVFLLAELVVYLQLAAEDPRALFESLQQA